MCSNGDIVPTSFPCPPPSASFYYEKSLLSPSYTPTGSPINGKSHLPIPVVFVIAMQALIVVAFLATGCILWMRRRTRRFSNRAAYGVPQSDERLNRVHAMAVTSQAQTVTLPLDGSGLEEKLLRILPAFYYRPCMSDTVAQDPFNRKLLQLIAGCELDKQDHMTSSNSYGGAPCSQDECAVCLSRFQEKERVRILPTCAHLFQVACIDMWLQSHTNCPVCRQIITLPAIHQFLSNLEFYCDDDQDTRDSLAENGGLLVSAGVEKPVYAHHTPRHNGVSEDGPSPTTESYH
ncbi:hypothetical protein KP509_07G079700 [Ceratopteris richardii]|uniref:RING-type E3 ubiquitin transferase n=1 Tax=Ceratopteris richardii TaxID=49495 RepID=A0A8T2UMZ2_CERRI|nr:hypothetical protein KP509_07G079700 [Ceratopteris richardii]